MIVQTYLITPPLSCAGCGMGISRGMSHWCRPAWCMTTSVPIVRTFLSNDTRIHTPRDGRRPE